MQPPEHSAFARLVAQHMQGQADGVALLSLASNDIVHADGSLAALRAEPAERRAGLVSHASASLGGALNDPSSGLDLLGRHFVVIERWTAGFHAVSAARRGAADAVFASVEPTPGNPNRAAAPLSDNRQTLFGLHAGHSVLAVIHSSPLGGSNGQEVRARALHLADVLRGQSAIVRA
ncbi:hypothetical protein T492DRAFT_968949 [Pavlovales sp. CCMP2436]|nr:hypothetical protein T492DRAFT_968949 [Pavlovales sp. CCMP2436]|mmetsp:Transcript_8227/g.21029  ORF Transcript_8227/g.21029 Transcript_8227/m.21029 type:complete len:177 (+) Transcript_8227:284-814(+)